MAENLPDVYRVSLNTCLAKHLDDQMVSSPNFGLRGPKFESHPPPPTRWNSSYDCTSIHCTEPFIIALLLSGYDLNNVERDVKHQAIIITYLASQKLYLCNQCRPISDAAEYVIRSESTLWKTTYSEPSLQRHHLFRKTLPFKWICCCTEYLMSRLICKKGLVLFLFLHRTYLLDIC